MKSRNLGLLATGLMIGPITGNAIVIDFEGGTDGDAITNQYSSDGLSVSGAIFAVAGLSLNDLEAPPKSGTVVALSSADDVSFDFSTLQSSFSAYFTYSDALSVWAYDSTNSIVAAWNSPFVSNLAVSVFCGQCSE